MIFLINWINTKVVEVIEGVEEEVNQQFIEPLANEEVQILTVAYA